MLKGIHSLLSVLLTGDLEPNITKSGKLNDNTDLAYIKSFLDAKVPKAVNRGKLKAIRTMYTTRTTEPTTVEKTMTPTQLFQANSPFWAEYHHRVMNRGSHQISLSL